MKRLAVAALVLALAVPPASGAPLALRASARAAPIHGFYDHVGLFPVTILNLSVPYAAARFEPGPATEALGSFLWDPEVASLGTIVCILSEGQVCGIPDYPFVARASYPSGAESDPPPPLAIEDPSPVQVRLAHQEASATATGSAAEADVKRLVAIPMTADEGRAAVALARTVGSLGTGVRPDEWLLEVGTASARSFTRSRGGEVEAVGVSRLSGMELLGGMVTVEEIRGEARAAAGRKVRGNAYAHVVRMRVAGYEASVGPRGLHIVDERLGEEEAATLEETVNDALAESGLVLSRGRERVKKTSRGVVAEAFAFSIEFERQVVPEELPEGTQGLDVLRVPVGYARAEAGAARLGDISVPETAGTGGVSPSLTDGGGGFSPPIGTSSPIAPVPPSVPSPEPTEIAAAPSAGVVRLPVPTWGVVAAILGAIMFVVGLTWLRVREVLEE